MFLKGGGMMDAAYTGERISSLQTKINEALWKGAQEMGIIKQQ